MQTIEISVKSDYLPLWGFWEGIREIIQNAIDAGLKKVRYDPNQEIVVIEDTGPGFSDQAFLIGFTTKNGESSIGQFGEGLKFGSLALIRADHPVEIETQNRLYIPVTINSNHFGTEVLGFERYNNTDYLSGTRVTIRNVTPSEWQMAKSRVLLLNDDCNPDEEILTQKQYQGKIYYKGIFVHQLDSSLWGYNLRNLNINRDRDIVDEFSLRSGIGAALARTDNPEIIEEFVRNITNQDVIESNALMYRHQILKENASLWTRAWERVWGDKTVIETDPTLRNEVEYCRYKTVRVPYSTSSFFEGLIKTDKQIVDEMREHKWEDLGLIDVEEYPLLDKIYQSLSPHVPIHWLRIEDEPEWLHIKAISRRGKIYINEKYRKDEVGIIRSFLHELTHVLYGYEDNTPDFDQAKDNLWERALRILLKTKKRRKTYVGYK